MQLTRQAYHCTWWLEEDSNAYPKRIKMYTLHEGRCRESHIASFHLYPEAGLEIVDGHGDLGVELLLKDSERNGTSNLKGDEFEHWVDANGDIGILYGQVSQVSTGYLHSIKADSELRSANALVKGIIDVDADKKQFGVE
ncbi:hypothetical protein HG531_013142 [Fusarium graminearum]|nr:hypothetical protein HG531_013142 [Fusarium graminearum]